MVAVDSWLHSRDEEDMLIVKFPKDFSLLFCTATWLPGR